MGGALGLPDDSLPAEMVGSQIALMPDADLQEHTTGMAAGTPIVMMHGMGDFAENPLGMVPLRKRIAKGANAYVHSVELCSKPDKLGSCVLEDQSNGFLMTMDDQVDQFARVVQADKQLV